MIVHGSKCLENAISAYKYSVVISMNVCQYYILIMTFYKLLYIICEIKKGIEINIHVYYIY